MTAEDSLKLERFTRLAAKSIQKLPMRTRTDMALGMLGWLPMSARVEKRKLMFLQKLCTMPPDTLTRKIFDVRLNLYILKGCSNQLGYIPDILKIASKYDLVHFIRSYMATSVFPSKSVWKNIAFNKIKELHESSWLDRTSHDDEFTRFKTLHSTFQTSVVWQMPTDRHTLTAAFLIAKLWTRVAKEEPVCCY